MQGLIPRILLILVVSCPGLLLAASASSLVAETRVTLQSLFEQGIHNPVSVELLDESEQLTGLYQGRGYEPLWIRANGVHSEADALLGAIEDAGKDGLEEGGYNLSNIRSLIKNERLNGEIAAELELLLSDAFFRLATHLNQGRLVPTDVDKKWHIERPPLEPGAILVQALGENSVRDSLAGLAPSHPRYLALRFALERLKKIAEAGGWLQLPAGQSLKLDVRDEQVVLLRKRLRASGDLHMAPRETPDHFDESLEEAVRLFQLRHGLEVDGIVGPLTRAALNVPVEQRINQLLLNLERWRWLPRDLGPRHVLVNMAGFELDLVEENRPPLWMRVIVGKTYRQTPTFTGRMTYLVLNPTWTIPPRILKMDILPQLKKNPLYLEEKNIRVFEGWAADAPEISPDEADWTRVGRRHSPYKLRQEPGPDNALGRIKFMLNNPFDIYLHDTPKRKLFDRAVRTFSSGCIRLERPLQLAERLMGGAKWDREKLVGAIESEETQNISLPKPVPVYFVYMTAWVDGKGMLQFRPDIYKRDKGMEIGLFDGSTE